MADGSASSTSYAIDFQRFSERLKGFYGQWRDHKYDLWGSCDAIAIAVPPASSELLTSSALSVWLLEYEFPEIILVFMNKHIHILCSQKKASLLKTLKKSARDAVGADLVVHVKAKYDDGASLMNKLISAMRSQSQFVTVGHVSREASDQGKLLKTWWDKLHGSALQLTEVSNGFSELFAIKDGTELCYVKKAAYLSFSVMKAFVVPKLEMAIDEEQKISHSSLMKSAEKAITEPATVKVKLKAENIDVCYPLVLQSGGKFDLGPSASSNDDDLCYDSGSVIVCALGSRYKSYCGYVARTFLIDSAASQTKAYEVLLKAHAAAIAALKPGNTMGAAYIAARAVVERAAPKLLPKLTKSAGAGMGLEFREAGLRLTAENKRPLKTGMVFNVSLGFQDLQAQTHNPKTEKYSLFLADTVIIGEKSPQVATDVCSKAISDVAYSFGAEEMEEDALVPTLEEPMNTEACRSKALRSEHNIELQKKEQRRQHQEELGRQKNEETARRLLAGGRSGGAERMRGCGGGLAKTSVDQLVAFKNMDDMPPSKDLVIQVDQKHEAVLVPIQGSMVPFHVSTVKSICMTTSLQNDRTCTIRITFDVPVAVQLKPHDAIASSLKFQGPIYLKHLTFRCSDQKHGNEVVRLVRILQRQVASRESQRAEKASLVAQERLVLFGNRMKPIKLQDMLMRTSSDSRTKKPRGALEAHVNGFRYVTSDGPIDIMYANIKHALFQPAEREMIALLHFHLHHQITVGKKTTKDVQFYVEVMDGTGASCGRRASVLDRDEIEDERRERERIHGTNMELQNFVNKVHAQCQGFDLEFDMPMRELGFLGAPHRSSVFIVPTSNCLVQLTEKPFMVVTLDEIEIVNLERVGFAQTNSDMAIVYKDFKRDVLRIDSIPSSSMDAIRDWLDTCDIKYYESTVNLSWRPLLQTIIDDPEPFIEEGCWQFLDVEASDSESDNAEESEGYEPSESECSGSDDDDDDDDDDSEMASLTAESESEEEEEGKTWEELEQEARDADRKRDDEGSDIEEEKTRRRKQRNAKDLPPTKRRRF